MRSKGDQSHTLSYIRSISMPGNRHSTLKEALFVDIRVSTDLLQPGLFASNEENKAYYRLLMIQSWIKSDGKLRHCPDVIAACFPSIGDGRASGIEWSHVHGQDALFTSYYWGCCWRKSWFWSAPVTFSRQSQVLLKESFTDEGRSSVSDGGKRKDLAKALFVDIREAVD